MITFDNTNGPVNLWIGPSGSTSNVLNFVGTTKVAPATDGSNEVNIYNATRVPLNLLGNATLYANVICYNKDANGVAYGSVTCNGNPTVYGCMLVNTATLQGNSTLSLNVPPDIGAYVGYFGYDNSWQELNPR
jgi:hypothetical protein